VYIITPGHSTCFWQMDLAHFLLSLAFGWLQISLSSGIGWSAPLLLMDAIPNTVLGSPCTDRDSWFKERVGCSSREGSRARTKPQVHTWTWKT
jgi:hypothetical protein